MTLNRKVLLIISLLFYFQRILNLPISLVDFVDSCSFYYSLKKIKLLEPRYRKNVLKLN